MKLLVLAAGFATRLPIANLISKPLLPLGGEPALNRILDPILGTGKIEEIFVVTNARYVSLYNQWSSSLSRYSVEIINDGATDNENRLGAIGDLNFVLQRFPRLLDDELMVVAGDNLILKMDVDKFICPRRAGASQVAVYPLTDTSLASQYGIVELDETNRVVSFEEKPAQPKSNLAATALYLFDRKHLALVEEYLKDNSPDQPGRFVKWLSENHEVYGWKLPEGTQWMDIGSDEQLAAADQAIRRQFGMPVKVGAYTVSPYYRFRLPE